MQTLKSLRERAGFSQKQVADSLGVSGPMVTKLEGGQVKTPSADHVTKMARLYGTTADQITVAMKRVASIVSVLGEVPAVIKSADPDEIVKVATYLHRITQTAALPESVRKQALKFIADHDEVIKASLSQTLGAGPFPHHRDSIPGVTRAGGPLDQDIDATGFRVARDGQGNWYLVDETTDPPTISPAQFGDLVFQQGQPLGAKAATKSTGPYRDGFGHKRNKKG